MTDVERYEPGGVVVAAPSLAERAKDLAAAYEFGKALSSTSFAPKGFAGKPEETAAAILCGDEVGLSPMQSLRSFFVIGGTPAMYARAMTALVLSHGHEIWTEEDTPAKVTVCGRRRGSDRVESVTWTSERAKRAGYTSNKKYETDPQAMLYARAASDVARRVAPDVLLGLGYSAEEVELSEVDTTPVARAPKKVARKPTAEEAAKVFDSETEPEPDLEEPPADRPRRVEDVKLPEPPVEQEQKRSDPPDRPGVITASSLKMLHVMLNKVGMGNDRDRALAFYAEHGGTGRRVESSKDLTRVEAKRIIDALVALEAELARDEADAARAEHDAAVHDAEIVDDDGLPYKDN